MGKLKGLLKMESEGLQLDAVKWFHCNSNKRERIIPLSEFVGANNANIEVGFICGPCSHLRDDKNYYLFKIISYE